MQACLACLAPAALVASITFIRWVGGGMKRRGGGSDSDGRGRWGMRVGPPQAVWLAALLLLCWMPELCHSFSRPHLLGESGCPRASTCRRGPMTRMATTTARRTVVFSSVPSSSDAGGTGMDGSMDMGEVLESLRREAASSKRNTLQLLSDRSQPPLPLPSLPSSIYIPPARPSPPSLRS